MPAGDLPQTLRKQGEEDGGEDDADVVAHAAEDHDHDDLDRLDEIKALRIDALLEVSKNQNHLLNFEIYHLLGLSRKIHLKSTREAIFL